MLRYVLFPVMLLSSKNKIKEVPLEFGTLTTIMIDLKTILVLKKREKVDSKDIRYISKFSVYNGTII